MATELDLSFGGDDEFPSASHDPIDVPVLNRLDKHRYEYRGQQIIRQGSKYAVEGAEGLHRSVFHATERIDQMRQAAFNPHAQSQGSGVYNVGGTEIYRRGPKSWEVSSSGELHKTLKAATQSVASQFRNQFVNPNYSETIFRNVAGSAQTESVHTPSGEPTLNKIQAGQYQYQGFDISRKGSSWVAANQKYKTLTGAVGGLDSLLASRQPLGSVIQTATGNQAQTSATVNPSANISGSGPITVDVNTRTRGGVTGRFRGSVTGEMSYSSGLAMGTLDPSALPQEAAAAASSGLTPPHPLGAFQHVQEMDPEEAYKVYRHTKRDNIQEMLRQKRVYYKQFSDQHKQIVQGHKFATRMLRNNISELQGSKNVLGQFARSMGQFVGIDRRDIPGDMFGDDNAGPIAHNRSEISRLDTQKRLQQERLDQQKFEYITEANKRLHRVRGATFKDQEGLNTSPADIPGQIDHGFNMRGMPPVPPLPPKGDGGWDFMDGGWKGIAGAALGSPVALVAAITAVTQVFQKLSSAADRVVNVYQGQIKGLAKDDPFAYISGNLRNTMAAAKATDPSGGLISGMIGGPMEAGLNFLELIAGHTERMSMQMKAFAPQTLSGSIEDQIKLFEADINNARQIDPTMAAINSAKTDAIIEMREIKTTLTEIFGPILREILSLLTVMLQVINIALDALKFLWDFSVKLDRSGIFKLISWFVSWKTESKHSATAKQIQGQISRFFGTRIDKP